MTSSSEAMNSVVGSVAPTVGIVFDPSTRSIRKRDGDMIQPFTVDKIRKAITKAWSSDGRSLDEEKVERVVQTALAFVPDGVVDIEELQTIVENALMMGRHYDVARHYIIYREDRAKKRAIVSKPDPLAVGDYIHASKYARHRSEFGRREVYAETVDRDKEMHVRKFPHLEVQIEEAFGYVHRKQVLPSMRSMQFGGLAIEVCHARQYNCCFTHIDRFEAFSQSLYLLLCGCGVGYSVQYEHVDKLPAIGRIDEKKFRHHVVEDTIDGWGDAAAALFQSFQDGITIEFAFHKIRDAGSILKTSGGRAPGHAQLKKSLESVRGVLLGAQGRQLRPLEAHRIMCMLADAPLSGGIRRSAMISLFSPDDSEMRDCKTGNWYSREGYFKNANNSAIYKRDEASKKLFMRNIQATKAWGDPGFYFTWDLDYGANPCVEIGLHPILTVDDVIQARLVKKGVNVEIGSRWSGFAFCNLTTINAAKLRSQEDFMAAAKAATFIGTLQASYTNFPYLGWVSEAIAERDALLGVSMTGMLDAPSISCNPTLQRAVARRVKEWNREFAELLGIEPAARTTCVKPEGTASLELGGVATGQHGHHARRYFKRIIANEHEFIFQEFRKTNPHMAVRKPDGEWVLEFPVEAPQGAILKGDMSALEFLKMGLSTQKNWVVPGLADDRYSPRLQHNVSITVQVKSNEWDDVAEFIWANRDHFTGVSLFAATGDKDWAFAPNEAVETASDEARWADLVGNYKPVDYTAMVEIDDGTDLKGEAACAGGACEVNI
jgi:ribonucleoside-triphosphate reductase (thioredoxin)